MERIRRFRLTACRAATAGAGVDRAPRARHAGAVPDDAALLPPAEAADAALPIVVDLDGTLIRSDLMVESALALLRAAPLEFLRAPLWFAEGGRAAVKAELARRAPPDPAAQPYETRLIDWLRARRAEGRRIVLATAADAALARAVADHLGLFDDVLASDGQTNLKGAAKAAALRARFPGGFVYCGDARPDLDVWRAAEGAVPVNAPRRVRTRIAAPVLAEFPPERPTAALWLRALRAHQWSKNLLALAPLFLSHQHGDVAAWIPVLLGILALGLVASGTYLLNDLLDLAADRAHWTKRLRPLASGRLPLRHALAAAPALVLAGLAVALALGPAALACVLGYLALTLAYSLRLKGIVLLDVAAIAALFVLRLAFGVVLAEADFSPWLMGFAAMLFLSLALAKRHTECLGLAARGAEAMPGRGWRASDAGFTLALGVGTMMGAVLIFLTYLTLDAAPAGLYRTPEALWGIAAAIFLWAARIWLLAARGRMRDDPVAFAVRDRTSWAYGAVAALCFFVAL